MTFFKHEFKINLKTLFIWSGAVSCFSFVMLLMFPQFGGELDEMTDIMAKFGAFSSMFSLERIPMGEPIGFYGIEVGAILSLGGSMFAAILGCGMLAKEEANHTTEYIFVTPNNRKYFITQKLLACGALIVVFDIICLLVSVAGFLIIGEDIEWSKFFMFHLAQLLMHLQIGALCFSISAFIRKMSLGIGIGVSLVLYFMHLLGNITDSVEKLHYITPFYYCDAATVFEDTSIPLVNLFIGIGMAGIAIAMAYARYMKKDLSI